nr:MAG TPA: helix-turn-helix domain protein [Caudoviricetes sp.]
MKTMGTRLKELRLNAGYTGEEVGRMLQVSKSAISMWEKDLRSPSADLIERFADIYGVSTDYIITGKESSSTKNSYYYDAEVAELAEQIKNDSELRILLDAKRNLSKQDMEAIINITKSLLQRERGDE